MSCSPFSPQRRSITGTWPESEFLYRVLAHGGAPLERVVVKREGSAPASVVETHISILFFIDDRVYKLRKHIQFGFLDFRDRAARYDDCRREVNLNRRLAPDVYLGVADVEFGGEPIDHMVVMRRLPEERRLATLARDGQDLDEQVRQVAETMYCLHRATSSSQEISATATGPALQEGWDANFSETAPFIGKILDPEVDEEIRSLVSRWIKGRQSLFDSRITAGRICDGHGDLQAADIFCLDDGVRVLDCVEFSDQLRYGDVCADVAFLAMDLERLGRTDAAEQFLDHYQDIAGDRFPVALLHHYIAARAYIRAKVACLRVGQGDESSRAEARQLHSLSLAHLRRARVKLVLIGGLPGSGKSTIAAGVSRALGSSVLRSDIVRRAMSRAAVEEKSGYGLGHYAPMVTAAVYSELLARAEELLMRGESVVLDASWIDNEWRMAAGEVASRTDSDIVELSCRARSDVADARIEQRLFENSDASEATPEVRTAMQAEMDPWLSSSEIETTDSAVEESIARAIDFIDRDH